MRGKEQDQRHRRLHPGITPACAGKSRPITWATSWRRDHPRMCGEKSWHCLAHSARLGSPPHVRGKVPAWLSKRYARRITPACAGKRISGWWTLSRQQDHPRMCGEKRCLIAVRIFSVGSPPHVRGKGCKNHPYTGHSRITPACAGKSDFFVFWAVYP